MCSTCGVNSSPDILFCQPHESASAAITYISTCFSGNKQSYAQRFISSPSIAFLLPVTAFLILLINYTGAELLVRFREQRLSEFNLSFDFLHFLGLILPLLSSKIKHFPLIVHFRFPHTSPKTPVINSAQNNAFVIKEAVHLNRPLHPHPL